MQGLKLFFSFVFKWSCGPVREYCKTVGPAVLYRKLLLSSLVGACTLHLICS